VKKVSNIPHLGTAREPCFTDIRLTDLLDIIAIAVAFSKRKQKEIWQQLGYFLVSTSVSAHYLSPELSHANFLKDNSDSSDEAARKSLITFDYSSPQPYLTSNFPHHKLNNNHLELNNNLLTSTKNSILPFPCPLR
jgi:hypothetical protein